MLVQHTQSEKHIQSQSGPLGSRGLDLSLHARHHQQVEHRFLERLDEPSVVPAGVLAAQLNMGEARSGRAFGHHHTPGTHKPDSNQASEHIHRPKDVEAKFPRADPP